VTAADQKPEPIEIPSAAAETRKRRKVVNQNKENSFIRGKRQSSSEKPGTGLLQKYAISADRELRHYW
jgi:hypothetical protein